MEAKELVYFKKNVSNISIGVRADLMDRKGKMLTNSDPYYVFEKDKYDDFMFANARLIKSGAIIETTKPSINWSLPNAITDERAAELVKSFVALKNELPKVDSTLTVEKLLSIAQTQGRPAKTIKLIEARLAELNSDSNDDWAPPALDSRKPPKNGLED